MSRTLAVPDEHAPRAGDRFPWLRLAFEPGRGPEDLFQRLDDTRFNLLVIGQPAPAADSLGLGDLLRVHAIALDEGNTRALEAVSISGPAFYLLRPDGHIGLAGTELEHAALARWFEDCHLRSGNARPAVSMGARRPASDAG